MRFRQHQSDGRIEIQMAPMIDIVFQLLIFFSLTLRIAAPEGDFDINMPLGTAAPNPDMPVPAQEVRVRVEANPDGSLRQVFFGDRGLGNQMPASFEALNNEVAAWVASGAQLADEMEIELAPDYNLDYRYIVKAISACRGKIVDGEQLTLVEKIKFAPIQPPGE